MWDSWLVRIVGGLIVATLVWVWRSYFWKKITELFSRKQPKIAGRWRTEFKEDAHSYSEKVTLYQRGRRVTADFELEEDGEITKYHFSGTFQDLILLGTYHSTDETDFERGTILLRYTMRGTFEGQNSFFSKHSEDVVSSPYKWTRIE